MINLDLNGIVVCNEDAWIYEWFGYECYCPKTVKTAIAQAREKGEKLKISINSGGGDLFAGVEIYEALRDYDGDVEISVSFAASAASVIAMAAYCLISPGGSMMIHNVSCGANGDYKTMDKTSETLKKANEAVAMAYESKTKLSREELLDMMNKETWLNAEDAVSKGFCDGMTVCKNVRLAANIGYSLLPCETLDKIRNTIKSPEAQQRAEIETKLNFLRLGGQL